MAKQRKKRAPIDPNESKAQKFSRLASARMKRILTGLKNMKSLANKSSYEYTEEQINSITTALNNAVDNLNDAFAAKAEKDVDFSV